MSTCFVIQPFDGGPYDKRYDDVLAPAIDSAGLQPYRVDRDPAASIPIEQIESGIRAASVCLADITEDNPNVWFELGYAIAARTEVVMICSDQRTRPFPFDVQHRKIIRYTMHSSRDFEQLRKDIADRIGAILKKQENLSDLGVTSPVADVEGLSQHELVALVAIAQNLNTPEEGVSTYMIRQDMERVGFTRVATTIALTLLESKGLIESRRMQDDNADWYVGYAPRQAGMQWLIDNQSLLVLRRKTEEDLPVKDDDIPF